MDKRKIVTNEEGETVKVGKTKNNDDDDVFLLLLLIMPTVLFSILFWSMRRVIVSSKNFVNNFTRSSFIILFNFFLFVSKSYTNC